MINWIKRFFGFTPKAKKVEPVVEERPTPGELSLDVTLGHINRIKTMQPGQHEKPRVVGKHPAMFAPYGATGPRGRVPERTADERQGDYERAMQRSQNERTERSRQAARNHQFATQYSQPATPQDRTVDDLVMMAAVMNIPNSFRETEVCAPSRESDYSARDSTPCEPSSSNDSYSGNSD